MSRAPLALLGSAVELDAMLVGAVPVLLTFTGPKCIICRQLAPMLEVVVREAGDTLASAKADAEALPELAARFEVRSLPTTLVFRGGEAVARLVGFATAGTLRRWLAEHARVPGAA